MRKSLPIKETVLLIGGTGFIGRNILEFVGNKNMFSDFKFIVLTRSSPKEIIESVEYYIGDYSDKSVLIELFSKRSISKVFHLATSTTPLTSDNNFLNDIDGNLTATIGLLDVMKEFKCNYILFLSSGGAVYGEKQIDKICENEICEPVSSYGVVKLTIENYIKLYYKLFGINYLILRVSNPFGKFHTSESQGVINVSIRRALRGEVMEIWGDGSQSKDYIYVDDLIEILFRLLKANTLNKIINIGSGQTLQLSLILNSISNLIPSLEINYSPSKLTDVKDFCLDISLLKSIINFKNTDFDTALSETIIYETNKLLLKI